MVRLVYGLLFIGGLHSNANKELLSERVKEISDGYFRTPGLVTA